eukprot:1234492-Prymnesium_polylepis.1
MLTGHKPPPQPDSETAQELHETAELRETAQGTAGNCAGTVGTVGNCCLHFFASRNAVKTSQNCTNPYICVPTPPK